MTHHGLSILVMQAHYDTGGYELLQSQRIFMKVDICKESRLLIGERIRLLIGTPSFEAGGSVKQHAHRARFTVEECCFLQIFIK